MDAMTQDEFGRWVPAVPEPFWVRRWFRWKPACYQCKITFSARDEWDKHWLTTHADKDER